MSKEFYRGPIHSRRVEDGLEVIPKSELLFLAEMRLRRINHPEQEVIMTEVGKVLGISRERARQLYKQFSGEYEFPPRQTIEGRKRRSKLLAQQSQQFKKIKNEYLDEYKKGVDERKRKIISLRKKGLSNSAIAQATHLTRTYVAHILANELLENPDLRLRKKRRSEEEMLIFDAEVKQTRQKGLSDYEIAQELNAHPFTVKRSIKRMLQRGEIQRKVQNFK